MLTLGAGTRARTAVFGILFSVGLAAQPPLTTIQDVIYKADGARFNGYVQIAWHSFEASDTSNIATQFRAARIVDGNFMVKLVPTTNADPAATYTVTYNSDGKVQFQETWAVPPSSRPLRIRDVRISTPSELSTTGGPIQESDVVGLVADLNSRPSEGPGYATGRVLISNSIGELEAVSGNLTDCVRVDGSTGPCGAGGGAAPGYVDSETPGGVVDGANLTFALTNQPNPASSVALYLNGMLMKPGLDFTLTGSSVRFVSAVTPQPGDTLLAFYRVAASSSALSSDTMAPTSTETLCSTTGGMTLSAVLSSLGTCVIPAGTLKPGDRVEMRFDYAHTGILSGFKFSVRWGGTTIVSRDAPAADTLITGRADAAVTESNVQWNVQSWGASLSFGAGVGPADEPLDQPLTVTFLGSLAQPLGDSVTLSNFTVLRYYR